MSQLRGAGNVLASRSLILSSAQSSLVMKLSIEFFSSVIVFFNSKIFFFKVTVSLLNFLFCSCITFLILFDICVFL